jgi:membrane-associated protease RseP (regulator of RpoE activity)
MEWALMVVLVLGGGALARAQSEQAADGQTEPPGKIVRIAPAAGNTTADVTVTTSHDAEQVPQPEMPKHWIGILGGPIGPELRAQLVIPERQGLLVRQVVPDSPAAKAGLQNFDVLLRANNTELHEMADLMELVRSEGENGGKIALDVLRHGKQEAITITPEARPEQVAGIEPDVKQGDGMFAGQPPDAMRMFQQRFGRGGPFQFRAFGPGTVLQGRQMSLDQMPNGVSVSIQKQNDEPAQITVQRGNDTWNIVGDDPASLDQLPKDVRPFVEQLLTGGGPMQIPLPAMPNVTVPNAPMPPMPRGAFDDDALQQRLHMMEQQLQQMQLLLEQNIEPRHGDTHAESNTE